ncbi:MAG: ribonuclease R, partial [Victivallaceae bacterium]|nr:ribonuclease R [Victivallaceae bacterium]
MKKEKKKRLRRLIKRAERRRSERHEIVEGRLSMSRSGFGFVAPEVEEGEKPVEDIFIPAKFIGRALDGDLVRVNILQQREGFEDKGPAGKIVEVLEHGREELVGELVAGHQLRPLNTHLPEFIELSGARKGAKRGDWVRVRLHRDDHGEPSCSVSKVLGKAGEIASDLDAVMAEFNLKPRYSEADNLEAAALVPRELASREDATNELVVTIDPVDAKDFDDALSLLPGKNANEVVIGVHISDVAAYIAPKSKFDRCAAERGFSCYLPGRTLPMLPAALTASISLAAGQKSLAHSVYLTIDRKTGKVLAARRTHTLIEVKWRLDYEKVQEFFDKGSAPDAWTPELKKLLSELLDITRRMRSERRRAEEFIDLALPEIRILCSENDNRILGLSVKTARESENVVEECMLAANSAVGVELGEKSIAGLYRVHPEPDEEKIAEFSGVMSDSFGIVPGNLADRKVVNKFIASLPDGPQKPVILNLLLRSLPRAGYAAKPALHFGLGKGRYSHFTSPIRRYPDLITHQQLWNFDSKSRLRSG